LASELPDGPNASCSGFPCILSEVPRLTAGIKQVLGTMPKIRIQGGGYLIPNHAYDRFTIPLFFIPFLQVLGRLLNAKSNTRYIQIIYQLCFPVKKHSELPWVDDADALRANDIKVLETGNPMFTYEYVQKPLYIGGQMMAWWSSFQEKGQYICLPSLTDYFYISPTTWKSPLYDIILITSSKNYII